MPVIRSQNTSFKRARKVTSAGKRQKGSFEFENGMQLPHNRNESQRLKTTSIEFDKDKEFEHFHDFNITQISIKVDSKRNALDLSSNVRLKTLSQAIVKNKTLENNSILSHSSIVNKNTHAHHNYPKIISSSKKPMGLKKSKDQINSTNNITNCKLTLLNQLKFQVNKEGGAKKNNEFLRI